MNFFRVELLLLVQDTYNHLFSTIVGWVWANKWELVEVSNQFSPKKITLGDTQDEIYLVGFHWNENWLFLRTLKELIPKHGSGR
jgi:hypothetical protein